VSAPWTFGRVLSGLLAAVGFVLLVIGMFMSFLASKSDWSRQPISVGTTQWTCTPDTSGRLICDDLGLYGEIRDRGTSTPITVSLLGVGLVGISVMLRLPPRAARPAASPSP
jgi:hypothetical protein